MASARHGSFVRGMENVAQSSVRDQRFGRMFRQLPAAEFDEPSLMALAATMLQGVFAKRIAAGEHVDVAITEREPDEENPKIPAGYTYFGQFVDHDITFDPVSSLDRFNDPDALQDFRTPRLDLDSIYGSGPDDQPFLYERDGPHMLLGPDRDYDKQRNNRPDLPRNAATPARALIGDKRNDENSIVSQLQATFLRFHNAVADAFPERSFQQCQQTVRWHYQWIVLHDFLPRVVGQKVYEDVIGGKGQVPRVRFYNAKGRYAFIPVEFSVAAYRFGHSMVRPSYALNHIVKHAQPEEQQFGDLIAKFNRIPIFSIPPKDGQDFDLANLNGFRQLPDFWAIDWAFFLNGLQPDGSVDGFVLPQPSYRIDSVLVDPLVSLPDHQNQPAPRRSLAFLNLLRGWRMGLPSGQAVARCMGFDALTDAELFDSADLDRRQARQKLLDVSNGILTENAPLWYYILREAEIGGGEHLGPVGGTIVADVLAGLILEDRHSFLSQWPHWRPFLGAVDGEFTLSDLVRFTNNA